MSPQTSSSPNHSLQGTEMCPLGWGLWLRSFNYRTPENDLWQSSQPPAHNIKSQRPPLADNIENNSPLNKNKDFSILEDAKQFVVLCMPCVNIFCKHAQIKNFTVPTQLVDLLSPFPESTLLHTVVLPLSLPHCTHWLAYWILFEFDSSLS